MADSTSRASKKKQKRSVPAGQLHIQATFNNTIVSFTDKKGNVVKDKAGKPKQSCKTIKVHKKVEGTKVPEKK